MAQSSRLAIIGSPPGPGLPECNLFDFIFSNPFTADKPLFGCLAPMGIGGGQNTILPVPPQQPLFVDTNNNAQLTWSRARYDSLRVAAGLQALGLSPAPLSPLTSSSRRPPPVVSPTVLLHLPNSLPFPPLLFGSIAAGLTVTMANPSLTPGEIAWILQNARPEAVVTSVDGFQAMLEALEGLADKDVKERILRFGRLFVVDPSAGDSALVDAKPCKLPPGAKDWKALLASTPLSRAFSISDAHQETSRRTAVILWSSGTSGKSKGVLLSHRALTASVAGIWAANRSFSLSPQVFLGFVPFFHIFGLANVLLLTPCIGATVLVIPKFEPRRVLELVQTHRATFLHMAPPVAVLLAKSSLLEGFDLSSIKGGVSGGAPLAPEVIGLVWKRLGFLIKIGYGLSEAASVTNQRGDTWEELESQLGNAGEAMYGVEIKVLSTDGDFAQAKIVNQGQEGEICIRSPSIMSCYLNNEAATKESLDGEGWFHTGDVGKIDSLGRLWITDRLKEVIKVKGFQVSPSDLEGVLCGSPLVADAGVTSIYDSANATELPRAYVVPADPKLAASCAEGGVAGPELKALGQELRRWVEGKVTAYKWLRGNVVFIPQVPKSAAGKILRRLLKETKGVEVKIYEDKQHGQVKAKL